MKTKQLRSCLGWLIGLLWLWLSPGLVRASLAAPTAGLVTGWLADSDADGVDDATDLCPGTPVGTSVNAYGCPLSVASCDYSTSSITLQSSGGSSGTAVSTRYVLASNTGTILQISSTATFTGLSGTATYMALALTYDGAASNLAVGQSLSVVSASCLDWSDALSIKVCVAPVTPPTAPLGLTLCPNTPAGVAVNAYGCPLSVSACDYTTSSITFQRSGGSSGVGVTTSYVLASNTGTILQISSTPSFTGLTGTATYMALAVTYDGTASSLALGSSLSAVSASCLDWSDALPIKVCVTTPTQPPTGCDYQIGQPIALQIAGGSLGAGIKTSYVLTDTAGKLVRLATTPSFVSTGLVAGTYLAYALTYTDDNTIAGLVVNGTNTLSGVTASCLAVSPGLSLTLCGNCVPVCLPFLVTRIR